MTFRKSIAKITYDNSACSRSYKGAKSHLRLDLNIPKYRFHLHVIFGPTFYQKVESSIFGAK